MLAAAVLLVLNFGPRLERLAEAPMLPAAVCKWFNV